MSTENNSNPRVDSGNIKVLVIGSGGREHALAWKLRHSPRVHEIFVAPGNAGTACLATNVAISAGDFAGLLKFAEQQDIDLTVVGPDNALAGGVVDLFEDAGRRIFGPRRAAARLESSKSFAKDFMVRHGIPTAYHAVCRSRDDAQAAPARLSRLLGNPGAQEVVEVDDPHRPAGIDHDQLRLLHRIEQFERLAHKLIGPHRLRL